jgi:uncharacterized protein YecT (DUF1311 family)
VGGEGNPAKEMMMKRQVLMALIVGCWLATPAHADDTLDCKDPQDQNSMTRCAGIDYDQADKELNALWPSIKASAEENDKGASAEDGGYVKALMASQKAWIAFRDAECTWQGFESHGGSMEPMLVNGCLATLTRERIKQLTENQEGLAN